MSFIFIAFRKWRLQKALERYKEYFYLSCLYEFTWLPVTFDPDKHFVVSLQLKPTDSLLAWHTEIVLCLHTNFDLWVRWYFTQLIEQHNNQTLKGILKSKSACKLPLPVFKSVHFEDQTKTLEWRPSCAPTGTLVNINPVDGSINTQVCTYCMPKDPRISIADCTKWQTRTRTRT